MCSFSTPDVSAAKIEPTAAQIVPETTTQEEPGEVVVGGQDTESRNRRRQGLNRLRAQRSTSTGSDVTSVVI